jgi:hypothetical protein
LASHIYLEKNGILLGAFAKKVGFYSGRKTVDSTRGAKTVDSTRGVFLKTVDSTRGAKTVDSTRGVLKKQWILLGAF